MTDAEPARSYALGLRAWTARAGLSNAELSRATGKGTSAITELLNGRRGWRGTAKTLALATEIIVACGGSGDDVEAWQRYHTALLALPSDRRPPAAPEPARDRKRPHPYWATVDDVRRRTPELRERDRELAAVTATTGGYTWVRGPAYAGKTALLAHAATTLRAAGEADVISYFLSLREATADAGRMLAVLVSQLAELLGEPAPMPDPMHLADLWSRAVDRAETAGRPLLMIVDALDEERPHTDRMPAYGLLPARVSALAGVLIGTRDGYAMPALPPGHPVHIHREIDLSPLDEPRQAARLARAEIDKLLDSANDEAVEIVALLAAAGGPIALDDLLEIQQASTVPAQRRRVRRIVDAHLAHSLERVGTAPRPRYQFRHLALLEHAQAHPDLDTPEPRQRIHAWARGYRELRWDPERTPAYLLDTYPATLLGEPGLLNELVGDVAWLLTAIAGVGVDAVLPHLRGIDPLYRAVWAQAVALRETRTGGRRRFAARQLMMQALEDDNKRLAKPLFAELRAEPRPHLYPFRTTRVSEPALVARSRRLDDQVMSLAPLPDGSVAVAAGDRLLRWEPEGQLTELARHGSRVLSVVALADGRVVTTLWGDGVVRIHDPRRPAAPPVPLGSADSGIRAAAVLSDGRIVTATDTDPSRLSVWDPAAPGAPPVPAGHDERRIWRVAALPGGGFATVSDQTRDSRNRPTEPGDGGLVRRWETIDDATPPLVGCHPDDARAIALLPGERIVTAGRSGLLLLWDPAAAAPVELGHHPDAVSALVVLRDGRLVSAGEWGGFLLVWDPDLPGEPQRCLGRHDGGVTAMIIDGDRIVTGRSDLRCWDGSRWPDLPRRPVPPMVNPAAKALKAPDHGYLSWREEPADTLPRELGHHGFGSTTVAELTKGSVGFGTGWAWSPVPSGAEGELLFASGPISFVGVIAALRDGRYVLSDERGNLTLHNRGEAPVVLGKLDGPLGMAMAALPDGRVVTAAPEKASFRSRILVWSPPAAEPVCLGTQRTVTAIAVLPDGRVATGDLLDGRILVWDPERPGQDPVELGRHHGRVTALAVLADGSLVSGGRDEDLVQVWDVGSGEVLARVGCSVENIATAALGNRSSLVVIAHRGGDWSLWFHGVGQLFHKHEAEQLVLALVEE
ncbi:AAA family ATPase [Actinoplanes sp. NPDC051346]|uniref:AAA family ATPase n=1 Tax=Actinoplanes sp. NPDC051346 TaxID=3155048 RepID=UPI003415D1F5